jgi:deazaflavin-dependent oxidoreductase (nitroreductase family)
VIAGLDPAVAKALERGEVMDITTIGRRSGLPRRIELVYHNVDGRILISGRPGFPRSWIANLRANPRFTFHLKRSVTADLPATGRVITDRAERERLLPQIAETWRMSLPLMVASAPLVEVTFD